MCLYKRPHECENQTSSTYCGSYPLRMGTGEGGVLAGQNSGQNSGIRNTYVNHGNMIYTYIKPRKRLKHPIYVCKTMYTLDHV